MDTALTIIQDRADLATPTSASARKYYQASKAKNTLRAYAPAWREFARYCEAHHVPAFPASPTTIVEYLTMLADTRKKVSTIEVKLAAITFRHRECPDQNPAKAESVRLLMQGIRRTLGCNQTKKEPIKRDELVKMIATLGDSIQGKRDRAILLVGFAGAFRRSELAGLNIEDVRFGAGSMTITLRHSKTDQEGAGITKQIPMLADKTLCPVRALRDWMNAAQIKSGAVFRAVDRWGNARKKRIDDKTIVLIVKRAATAAGLEARQFAGHSLRAGFATQAATDGTPEWAIAEVTGHKSVAVLRGYIRSAGIGQMSAIKKAFGQNE